MSFDVFGRDDGGGSARAVCSSRPRTAVCVPGITTAGWLLRLMLGCTGMPSEFLDEMPSTASLYKTPGEQMTESL